MRRIAYRTCVSAIALGALGGAASAQVTAEQIWENWRGFSAAMGQTAQTGAETRSGDRLTITDAVFSSTDADVEVTSRFGQIVFRETGEGTVEVTFSPSFTVSVESTPSADDQVVIGMTFRHDGLKMVAQDAEEGLRYDFVADNVTMVIDRFSAEGEDTVMIGGAAVEGLTGNYLVGDPGVDRVQSSVDAARLSVDISLESESQQANMNLTASIAQPSGSSNARMLSALVEQAETRRGLPEGFVLEADYRFGSGDFRFDFSNREGANEGAISFEESTFDLRFDTEQLRYDVAGGPTSMRFSGSAVPVPEAAVALDASRIGFTLPVGASEGPRDMAVVARLEGLDLGAELWSLFDPANVLPRDPATLIVDIVGTAKWLVDPFNAAAMAAFQGGLPAELYDLNLNAVRLSALGADLKGSGAFTFDNDDLVSYDGVPKPVGEINLTLDGANALIDKLTGLGMLPQSQAMNVRMMLGLFARPGAGPDNLTSKIELREDGTIHANEQRLK
jgi:hypothetical protein